MYRDSLGLCTVNPAGEPGGTVAGALACDPARPAAAAMSELEFQRVYDATAGPILGYLAAVTGRRDVADDLLQETYCRLLLHSKAVAGLDAQETRRYLFRIATNLLLDRWRAGDDQPFAEPEEPAGEIPSVESSIDVRAMLLHLKPKERELLWLAYVEGMDHKEIAAATGLGRLSVRTLLFRARGKAKQFLSPGSEL
jgi:RNA polymerase sigma-70 factor (ECF subfamily)